MQKRKALIILLMAAFALAMASCQKGRNTDGGGSPSALSGAAGGETVSEKEDSSGDTGEEGYKLLGRKPTVSTVG